MATHQDLWRKSRLTNAVLPPSRYLTVFEHDELSISSSPGAAAITSVEAELLEGYGEFGIVVGRRSVRFGHYCGLIPLGQRLIEILPKVEVRSTPQEGRYILLRLLHLADELAVIPRDVVGQHLTTARLLEIFIEAFIREVADICRGGLLRRYYELDADLRVLRGRINANRQFGQHFNRTDLIACRYDELSANNQWNQCLKATLRLVRPWISDPRASRLWIEVFAVFEDVADVPPTRSLAEGLIFDRQARRYRTAIQWARWILGLLSPAVRAGHHSAPGLLINMNGLFENAVGTIVERSCRWYDLTVRKQDTTRSLANVVEAGGARAFSLRPDFVLRRQGQVVAIADAKWKRIAVNKRGSLMPAESDMYQLTAYAAAFRCPELSLIYPWHSGLEGSRETTYELPTVGAVVPHIHVTCIDVSKDTLPTVRGSLLPAESFLALRSTREARPA